MQQREADIDGGLSPTCARAGCPGSRQGSHPGSCNMSLPLPHDHALLAEEMQAQAQQTQKPYRIGLILLCVGALFNWLGLAQAYVEPMRYIGVGCIVAGALLICAAMCRWIGRSGVVTRDLRSMAVSEEVSGVVPSVHVISLPVSTAQDPTQSKPPDYESLVTAPPSYEDAIKLRPTCTIGDERAGPPRSPSSIASSEPMCTSHPDLDLPCYSSETMAPPCPPQYANPEPTVVDISDLAKDAQQDGGNVITSTITPTINHPLLPHPEQLNQS